VSDDRHLRNVVLRGPQINETPLDMTFHYVSVINATRCDRWHKGFPNEVGGWVGSDWSNAMQGEAGEAGNVVKKLRRMDFELPGNRDLERGYLLNKLGEEIADTFIYLDLLATFYGINLAAEVVRKFNRVSVREGFPERLL